VGDGYLLLKGYYMSVITNSQFRIEKLKKLAKKTAKSTGVSHSESLEIIAQENGYRSWHECRSRILKNDNVEPTLKSKVFSHEFDPRLHSPLDVRGLFPDDSGGIRIQQRHSYLNYISENFETSNIFRNRLEADIKSIISNSKQHVQIDVTVFAHSNTLNKISNQQNFFDAILNRYIRLNILHVISRDDQIPLEEFNEIIKDLGEHS
jgi:hypothetical protein